jgi:hypothetical protein
VHIVRRDVFAYRESAAKAVKKAKGNTMAKKSKKRSIVKSAKAAVKKAAKKMMPKAQKAKKEAKR